MNTIQMNIVVTTEKKMNFDSLKFSGSDLVRNPWIAQRRITRRLKLRGTSKPEIL